MINQIQEMEDNAPLGEIVIQGDIADEEDLTIEDILIEVLENI